MLLTISTTREPATDLGYLLHKHPDRVQEFDLAFGSAQVFYPEVGPELCTAALLLDVDPIGLVRGRGSETGGPLGRYVNDRPYVASSFLSVAIGRVFGTALSGTCKQRPELVAEAWPLQVRLAVVPARGGEALLQRLFEPLGYSIVTHRHPLDARHEEWGASPYFTVTLTKTTTLRELLAHLYVLIPVLDDDKHYYIGVDEVDKLLRHGAGWLANHPAREEIALRSLRRQRSLARMALERLRDEDESESRVEAVERSAVEEALEQPLRLHRVRLDAVRDALHDLGAKRVLDLGCGEGKLLRLLLRDKQFECVVGLDTSIRCLEVAAERLHLDEMAPRMRERVELLHGSLTYRDTRLEGFDAAALVEVIEHVEPSRLSALERVVFEHARPTSVVVTTPNAEYNVRFAGLPAGRFRHADHRFEWTRSEFATWAASVSERFGYASTIAPIGDVDDEVGSPCQMAVFRR
ncbi:MAG: 3' terminal RNA ribose 2'-O-methyltransferase Hen1 [Planctomycetes bacterium]|nr:3' terminal RNA ribose 2'-O-methyltransferase Hen1 [Planctomycetota bacterium]MCB9890985.1 3' terminal RNA ribose 2'-O-methyltransferase Hen1 [Planctomycetota bacterium]MCB9919162.1 3' terminal RNA ribose 2'-O-methyltransferase Hen1 [Planctomycetota bacterium]